MSEMRSSWSFVGLTPEARKAAEEAAEAAGMDLDTWLSQLIKYRSAIELRGGERTEADGGQHGAAVEPESGHTFNRPAGRYAGSGAGQDTDRATPERAAPERLASERPARDRAPSGAYVRPDTAARSEKDGRSLEARAAELRRREISDASPPSSIEPHSPRGRDDVPYRTTGPTPIPSDAPATSQAIGQPTGASASPMSNPPTNPPPSSPRISPVIASTSDRRPANTSSAPRDIPQAYPPPVHPESAHTQSPHPPSAPPTVSAPTAHVAVSDGVPRLIATDMLRPSLLGALNVVGEGDVDAAYERWLRSGRLEPLTVRMAADSPGSFEIVAGIDRWHAARRAKAPEVPIIERALNDEEAIREGLAARLKRGHISALEEADIYLRLMTDAAQTTEQVARLAGKPPAHIATMVRVLNLPRKVREQIERGDLTILHARALLDTQDPETIAQEIVERRLDIYQTEQLVRMAARDPQQISGAAPDIEPASAASAPIQKTGEDLSSDTSNVLQTPTEILERHLTHLLGLKVTIAENGDDGVVSLHYGSRDQLSELIARLNSSSEA